MKIIFTFTFLSFLSLNAYCQMPAAGNGDKNPYYSRTATEKLDVSNATWKKILPADLYAVAREGATERYIRMIIPMACNAQRYAVDAAGHTWDISSMTALLRPVSDIA